jgi:hypothetical protein
VPIADRADDVAHNFYRSRHAAQPSLSALFRGGRDNFSHGLAEARDADRFAGFAYLFEDREAIGFELGDGNFLHKFLVYTVISGRGQLTSFDTGPRFADNHEEPGKQAE